MKRWLIALAAVLGGIAFPLPVVAQTEAFQYKGIPLNITEAELQQRYPNMFCGAGAPADALRVRGDRLCGLGKEYLKCVTERTEAIRRKLDGKEPEALSPLCSLLDYGGARVDHLSFAFYNDLLLSISGSIDSDDFARIRNALTAAHGKPQKEDVRTVQNRMGATFQNYVLVWERADTFIRLTRYTSDIKHGNVVIGANSLMDEMRKRQGESAKKDAKGL
jgi:hypothetical protein